MVKISRSQLFIAILSVVFLLSGCAEVSERSLSKNDVNDSGVVDYSPSLIRVTPLTEIVEGLEGDEVGIRVYVDVLDSFGVRGKGAGIFRFELYSYSLHSADPKGERLMVWPDIDIREAVSNSEYWRDFLRAYEIVLLADSRFVRGGSYILRATFICSGGKRLTDDIMLKY